MRKIFKKCGFCGKKQQRMEIAFANPDKADTVREVLVRINASDELEIAINRDAGPIMINTPITHCPFCGRKTKKTMRI